MIMRTLSRIALPAGCALMLAFANQSSACENKTAASPKTRQVLMDQQNVACTCDEMNMSTVGYVPVTNDGLAASPKTLWLLQQNRAMSSARAPFVENVEIETTTVGYQPTG